MQWIMSQWFQPYATANSQYVMFFASNSTHSNTDFDLGFSQQAIGIFKKLSKD
jgi:hypothetical protein